jgi:hypothetical protein
MFLPKKLCARLHLLCSLQKALDKMVADWAAVEFRVAEYKDTGTYIMGGTDEIQVSIVALTDQVCYCYCYCYCKSGLNLI